MRNSKKIIIPIIIVLILLLIAGGAFAYVYMATDILRTDKEMFLKYISQVVAEDGFFDSKVNELYEKKQQTPYENSGDITFGVEYPDEELETIIDKVNDLTIKFEGKTDSLNQKVEKNIEIDYGNDVIFPINYRQDGNKFGVQTDKLSKKFISVKNENVKEFVSKFGVEDVEKIPNEIEVSDTINEFSFTTEELEQLKQIYGTVLEEQLLDENFSRIKNEQNESYILELSNEQIKNISIKMLEATKQNTLIIDKLNEIILAQDSEAETIEVSVIDDLIEDINETEISEIPNLKITLIESEKQLNEIIIESGESKISIAKNKDENSLSYNISCEIKEANNTSDIENEESTVQGNVYFNVQFTGLNELNDVQENYELGFSIISEEEVMQYDYKMKNTTQFADTVSIEELNKDNSIFLNDYDETQVTNFLTQVGTKLVDINKNQMAELGLKETENPLLYTNPVTMMVVSIFNIANETITDDLTMYEDNLNTEMQNPTEN